MQIKKFITNLLYLNAALFAALTTMHLYSQLLVKRMQATDLTLNIRSDLVMGDRVSAFLILSSKIGENKSFASIELFELQRSKPVIIGDRFGARYLTLDVKNRLLYGYVDVPVYFDAQHKQQYGIVRYYYSRFKNIEIPLIIWTVLFGASVIWFVRMGRINRKDLERQLQTKRHETIAQMSSMIAHDLRAPLGIFQRLLTIPPSSFDEMRASIKESLNRIDFMVESLRFADLEYLVKRNPVRLNFDFGVKSLHDRASLRGVTLFAPNAELPVAHLDERKIERAWLNLASNAVEAAKSRVDIIAEARGIDLVLRVIDDGCGVPPEIASKLFQRGMTFGKADGTGLGLAYVRSIAQGHGGNVNYKREHGLTIFEIHIPRAFTSDDTPDVQNCEKFPVDNEIRNVQIVSMLMTPPALAELICSKLTAYGDVRYEFISGSIEKADLIITNDVVSSTELLERDLNVFDINPKLSCDKMIERLKNKFGIT